MKFYIVTTEVTAGFDFCVEAATEADARALAKEAGNRSIKGGPSFIQVSTYEIKESDEK